jgi:phosphatidylserine/phosphatidylglycerophosphate/cardiolipin synthase-like enzyme
MIDKGKGMGGIFMKKTASILALSIAVALSLSGCSSAKNQPGAASQSTAATVQSTAPTVNATPTSLTDQPKDAQKTLDAPKQPTTATDAAATAEQPKIEYAFTHDKGHPEKMLIGVINEAKTSLDIAVYDLTNKDIVAAILEAKKRGVKVKIITDQQEAKTKAQAAQLKALKAAGIPIKENKHNGLMHLKVTIADKSVLTTGSFNYTLAAATSNDDVLVVIHDPKMAQDWDTEYEKMWADKMNYQDLK